MDLEKKLYKSKKNKMLGGVCGGIGEYFNIDPTLVRLGFVGLCIIAGGGLIAYIVALIIIPEAPEGYDPAAQAQTAAQPSPDPATTEDPKASTDDTGTDNDTPTMI
ncbi:MAG: PspC domain-containing protein [Clostridia bacterium]|nr:PspC domain-containing protein [Clostridia bacterium]